MPDGVVVDAVRCGVDGSPDSSQIITKGASGSSTIHIYDARTGNAAGHLDGHRQEIVGLLFTMDGKQLVSSSLDSTIRLWDWPSRKPVRVLTVPRKGAPMRLALAPDGRTLASLVVRFSTRSSQIQLWELDRPESHPSFQTIGIASYLSSVSLRRPVFTPDSRSIIALGKDGTLTQWDVASLSETRPWPWAATNHDFYMDISQDTGQAAFHQQGGDLRVLDMASGIIRTNVLGAEPFDQVRFLGKGQFLLTFRDLFGEGETARKVQVWDARTWRPAGAFSYQHIKRGIAPLGPTFSRADVFAVDSEGKLLVRDLTQPAAPPKMLALPRESDSESAFSAFAVSTDGRLAAAGQENGAISFWNLKTSEFLRTLGEYRGLVASLVFSPDGTRLITTHGSGGQIRLWDLESGQELLTLPVEGVNYDTVFSPDGRVLAAFDVTGHLYLWSAPSWDEIAAAEAKETAEVKQP